MYYFRIVETKTKIKKGIMVMGMFYDVLCYCFIEVGTTFLVQVYCCYVTLG